jgi:hypothetical protein
LLHFPFHSHYYSEQSTLPVLSVVWLKSVLISSLVDLGRNLAYRILGMLMFCPVFLGFRGKIMWMSHKVMLFDDSLYDKYLYAKFLPKSTNEEIKTDLSQTTDKTGNVDCSE